MLTRSWGSWSTTTMALMDPCELRIAECGLRNCRAGSSEARHPPFHSAIRNPQSEIASSHQLQHAHPVHVLPISPQPHPTVAAAPDELPGPAQPAGKHLVHEQIEAYPPADMGALPVGPRHAARHAKPAFGPKPAAAPVPRIAGRVARRPDA